jgi:D-glycero-alpha-D-manno-heptose-7-phosphate kinase
VITLNIAIGLNEAKKMTFDLKRYVIKSDRSVRDALKKVDKNHYGMILVISASDEVLGIATDGDIRRALIDGLTLEDSIADCMNKNYIFATVQTTRENLIKKLDGYIRFIPILDEQKKLKSIVSKDFIPLQEEQDVYIRSRAPVRVSFGGGGSDVTHYFTGQPGAVINSAISIYSHATMKVRNDQKIVIHSLDLNETLEAKNLDQCLKMKGSFGLIVSLLKVVKPAFGFTLYLNSDFPVGSGLGGSATLSAAVLGCFNTLRKDRWDRHEISEIAFQAERLHLGIAGGWQDQYAAVFGGFNFLEFDASQNIINPIRIQSDTLLELEENLVLCDTGITHKSGDIHQNQKKAMSDDSVKEKVKENVSLTYDIRNYLLRGRLNEFGRALDQTWQLKRKFSTMITNSEIDKIYNGAIENGALGGKLLGAGGGGFFIFYVPPFKKHRLIKYLRSNNLSVRPFSFEPNGLKTWTSRVYKISDSYKEL